MKTAHGQTVLNVVMPLLMIIFILGGIASHFHSERSINIKLATVEKRHVEEMEIVKKRMLKTDPLNMASYFESSSLITEYMTYVNADLDPNEAARIISAIDIEAQTYARVSEATILFTSQIETDFQPNSVSHADAVGLMQVMPSVWLESENPSNKDNLSAIGITTREQLQTIEGSIAAGAWVLNTYALECENMQENQTKKFYSRHKTIAECTSKKYFGGDHKWYFGRLKKAAGDFWFWMTSRDPSMKGQPRIIHTTLTTEYKTKFVES